MKHNTVEQNDMGTPIFKSRMRSLNINFVIVLKFKIYYYYLSQMLFGQPENTVKC